MASFSLPRLIETEYQTSIFRLITSIMPRSASSIKQWVEDFAAMREPKEVVDIASEIAYRTASSVNVQNMRTWREARQGLGGLGVEPRRIACLSPILQ
jgi:hypothetical protein